MRARADTTAVVLSLAEYDDLVTRALDLRRHGRIGVLWAENGHGRFSTSENESDPFGSPVPVAVLALKALVEDLDAGQTQCSVWIVNRTLRGKYVFIA